MMFIGISKFSMQIAKECREPQQSVDYIAVSKGQVFRKIVQMGLNPDDYEISELTSKDRCKHEFFYKTDIIDHTADKARFQIYECKYCGELIAKSL